MSPQLRQSIVNSSATRLASHVAALAEIGPRPDGSDADARAVDYIKDSLGSLGFEVKEHPLDVPVVVGAHTYLQLSGAEGSRFEVCPNLRSGVTPGEGIEAPLVYAGKGFESDLQALDLSGAVALIHESVPFESDVAGEVGWHLQKIHRLRDRGARAVIFSTRREDNEITTWGLYGLDNQVDDIPSVGIGYRDFELLREKAAASAGILLVASGDIELRTVPVLEALLPGDHDNEEVLFIGGHHETVPSCTGANDNASGIAILLETARLFAGSSFQRSVRLMVTCGEESGCWGAKRYLSMMQDQLRPRLKAVIDVDQVAGPDVRLVGHGTTWLNQLIMQTAESRGFHLRTTADDPKVASILGDAEPFWKAGFPAAMLAGWWSDPAYHTRRDKADLVNPNYLKVWCDLLAESVQRLADEPLPQGAN
jgi:aminopeptidase YwaD